MITTTTDHLTPKHYPSYTDAAVPPLDIDWSTYDRTTDVLLRASGEHLAQFFTFAHLPPHLGAIVRAFAAMAVYALSLPRNTERTVALRKLLEAKDAAVRAALAKDAEAIKASTLAEITGKGVTP